MKKAVLLIAALVLCGSMAFAAGPSIGCWGRTVFTLAAGSNAVVVAPNIGVTQGWGPNWGGNGPRMGVTTAFSSDFLEYKLTGYWNGDQVGYVNLYGTVKFIPNLFSVIVGLVNGDGFDDFRRTSPNPNSDVNNNNIGRFNGWGLILVLAPKDLGLEVAVQLMTPAPTGSNTAYDLYYQLHNINVAASYTLPNLLKISAGFVSTAINRPAAGADSGSPSAYNIFARLELLAVQNLTLWADGRFYGFEDNAIAMKYVLGAGYTGVANLGLFLGAFFAVPASPSTALSLGVNLEGTYDVGPITIGLIGKLGIADLSATGMVIDVQPYVNIDDFATRIAFEFQYNTAGAGSYTWAVPVYFTFGF